MRRSVIALLALMAGPAAAADLADGEAIYQRECASCHGAHLEGQPGWQTPSPDGHLKAPPHDETGHTWMHTEQELFQFVKTGRGAAAAPGTVTDMPVFGDRLPDAGIHAVLDFIASRWPPGYRAYQLLLDPNLDPARLPPGDWQLPRMCRQQP